MPSLPDYYFQRQRIHVYSIWIPCHSYPQSNQCLLDNCSQYLGTYYSLTLNLKFKKRKTRIMWIFVHYLCTCYVCHAEFISCATVVIRNKKKRRNGIYEIHSFGEIIQLKLSFNLNTAGSSILIPTKIYLTNHSLKDIWRTFNLFLCHLPFSLSDYEFNNFIQSLCIIGTPFSTIVCFFLQFLGIFINY